jgi:hypothetical protein
MPIDPDWASRALQHALTTDSDPDATDPTDDWLDIELPAALDPTPAPRPTISPELAKKLQQARILDARALAALPPPSWFIEDLLPYAPRTMLHGMGGSYKSFVMLDWMLSAATEMPWHGHEVRHGKVLYIAGEGGTGLAKRVGAWCATHGLTLDDLDQIDFMIDPINLGETEHTAVWAGFFDWMQYDYVVIDTLHTASAGSEENSSTEMGKVLENATRMVGPHCCLFYVHHTVKTGKGHRGSGALRDDMDVVVALTPVEDVDYVAQLSSDKIRDAEAFKPVNVCFSKYGEGMESSLYVSSIEHDVKYQQKQKDRPPTAIDRAAEAITKHGLDISWGQLKMSDALKDLDLGYSFAPKTVGAALARLRGKTQEVRNMAAGKDIQLDPEDR